MNSLVMNYETERHQRGDMHAALLVAILMVLGSTVMRAHAKTASEVFEQASKSVVIVYGLDAKGNKQSLGSGVVLPGGDVATNCHVIRKSAQFRVNYQQKDYPSSTRYTDWDRDVCTLNTPDLHAPAVTLGSTNRGLRVGARVYAIGAPKGLELTLSDGIVSSLRKVDGGQYIQITAPISPGSSGGGLFDENGRLLGLPTFYLSEGQQLNFAVPVEWIDQLPKRHEARQTSDLTTVSLLSRALELEKKQDWFSLLQHALRWTKAKPADAWAWFGLGLAYDKSGQPAKAVEAYQQTLRINPEHASAWNNMGSAYDDTEQPAKEIEAYQQALRIDPEYATAWYNLGAVYGRSGQPAKAIEAYQQALRIDPEFSGAWYNIGTVYSDIGQPAKAIEAYQQTLRINPEHASAWYNLGLVYGKAGQSPQAVIGALQQALRIRPDLSLAWYSIGIAYYYDGQREKVMEAYRRLKALDPTLAEKFFAKFVLP